MRLTLGRLGACADAVLGTVDLLPLHHDVLEAFVVGVEAVLQQLAERHRAAAPGKRRQKLKTREQKATNREQDARAV